MLTGNPSVTLCGWRGYKPLLNNKAYRYLTMDIFNAYRSRIIPQPSVDGGISVEVQSFARHDES